MKRIFTRGLSVMLALVLALGAATPALAATYRTIEYSVYTYVQRNQNTTNVAMRELLEAIYNYGESVKNA